MPRIRSSVLLLVPSTLAPSLGACWVAPRASTFQVEAPAPRPAVPSWASTPGDVAGYALADLQASPSVASFRGGPRLAVLPVEDRSRADVDTVLLTDLLTSAFATSARGTATLLGSDDAEAIAGARERLWTGRPLPEDPAILSRADYVLSSQVQDAPEADLAHDSYLLIRFHLLDADTGILAWSQSYKLLQETRWDDSSR